MQRCSTSAVGYSDSVSLYPVYRLYATYPKLLRGCWNCGLKPSVSRLFSAHGIQLTSMLDRALSEKILFQRRRTARSNNGWRIIVIFRYRREILTRLTACMDDVRRWTMFTGTNESKLKFRAEGTTLRSEVLNMNIHTPIRTGGELKQLEGYKSNGPLLGSPVWLIFGSKFSLKLCISMHFLTVLLSNFLQYFPFGWITLLLEAEKYC